MLRKDFIARASIALINKTYNDAQGSTSDLQKVRKEAAMNAVIMAEELADELERSHLDKRTIFFDPDDQPTTGIEDCLDDIKNAIESL